MATERVALHAGVGGQVERGIEGGAGGGHVRGGGIEAGLGGGDVGAALEQLARQPGQDRHRAHVAQGLGLDVEAAERAGEEQGQRVDRLPFLLPEAGDGGGLGRHLGALLGQLERGGGTVGDADLDQLEHAAGIVEIGLCDPQPVAGGEHLEVGVGDTRTRR